MPIPKNWLEELALEWLLLEGYITLTNVRLKSGKGGGTKEADVIGLKLIRKNEEGILKEILEIKHVETGSLSEKFEKT